MLFNPQPTMIVIHVGGNATVAIKQARLIKDIKRDINYLASVFPCVKTVWSDILPRKFWHGIENTPNNLVKMNEKRKLINRTGCQVVRELIHGKAIIHEIDTITSGLFKPDGVHLTLIGNAIFLITFKEALSLFLTDNDHRVYNANN